MMNRSADEIFNDALDKTGEERQQFLAEACAGNAKLRRDVDSLLQAYEAGDATLLPVLPPAVPARIGAYTIDGEIARGGMGVVYLARDDRLHRRVALKVLPPRLAREPDWLEQFQCEGQVLAALDHPNIATVHSLQEAAGVHFFTMEWVEGETLAERIGGRPLPRRDALSFCLQIARALEAAHARGIVHRDLKPLNIKVRPDGRIKVLDFGLAKVFGEPEEAPTPEALRRTGEMLRAGTPGYMAPEQGLGSEVDQQADIWAFGCILFETFTGRPAVTEPAGAESGGSAPAAPDLEPLRRVASPAIVTLVESTLQTDPRQRLSDMSVASRVLESELSAAPMPRRFGRPVVAALAGAAMLIAFFAVRQVLFRPTGAAPSGAPLLGRAGHVQLTHSGTARMAEISPDGSMLAWVDTRRALSLWVQPLPGGVPREIRRLWSVTELRWSPDARSLLVSGREVEGSGVRILRLAAADGAVLGEYDYDPRLSWAPDGTQFASVDENGLVRITDVRTGESQPLLEASPWKLALSLDWSPDGRLLVVRGAGTPGQCLWMVAVAERRAWLFPTQRDFWSPRWTEGGASLFVIDPEEDVWRFHVDTRTGLPRGGPELVLALSGLGNLGFSCTADGRRVVYARGPARSNLWVLDLGTHEAMRLSHGTLDHRRARFSPDGGRVLFARRGRDSGTDVYVAPATGGEPMRLTTGQSSAHAVWSPDGQRIAFNISQSSRMVVAVTRANGTGMQVFDSAVSSGALAWSPNRLIAFLTPGNHEIVGLDTDTGALQTLYECSDDFQLHQPQWAPDGRRMAFLEAPLRGSGEAGIVVLELGTGKRTVVQVGLATPIGWSSDGRWLHVVLRRREPRIEDAAGDSLATPASAGEAVTPTLALLRVPAAGGAADTLALIPHAVDLWSSIDVTPDGRRAVYCAADFVSDIWMVEGAPE